ncbi:MAG TPA: hypothetical protein DEB31_11155, partial [Clostridiales bacterium]|nr:hypothetical protein [Clostridiales bacterium]
MTVNAWAYTDADPGGDAGGVWTAQTSAALPGGGVYVKLDAFPEDTATIMAQPVLLAYGPVTYELRWANNSGAPLHALDMADAAGEPNSDTECYLYFEPVAGNILLYIPRQNMRVTAAHTDADSVAGGIVENSSNLANVLCEYYDDTDGIAPAHDIAGGIAGLNDGEIIGCTNGFLTTGAGGA